MYTHARACSVLRKAGEVDSAADYSALSDPAAQDVIRLIEQFPEILHAAMDRNEPSMITRFSVDIAQAYNKFYYDNKILDDDMGARAARINLTKAVKSIIKQALYLISIEAPEKM